MNRRTASTGARSGPPEVNRNIVSRKISGAISNDFSKKSRPKSTDNPSVTRWRPRRVRT
jgi:hypothetical protein